MQLPHTTICTDYCPTLVTEPTSDPYVCDDSTQHTICLTFDDNSFTVSDSTSGISIQSYNSIDYTDPIPVYQRGMYFESTSVAEVSGLVLNTRFSIEMVVRPESAGSLYEILTAFFTFDVTFYTDVVPASHGLQVK
jgi:hypothetical protein